MKDQVVFYQQQAEANLSPINWVAALQKKGISDFIKLQFPGRHDENWKYTPLTSFLQENFFVTPLIRHPECNEGSHNTLEIPLLRFAAARDDVEFPNIIIKKLENAFKENENLVKKHLNQILNHHHGFLALNTAMLNHGLFIYVPKNTTVEVPLSLIYQTPDRQAVFLRNLIILEENSSLTIIENFTRPAERSEGSPSYFMNVATEVYLQKNAKLTHYKIQQESDAAHHFSYLAVSQREGSQFHSHLYSTGGKLVRNDIAIDLLEKNANCFMNGIYTPVNKQHMDFHTIVRHIAPDCESKQDYKGILKDAGRAVFNGRVIVEKDAQHSKAIQQNKNLLLSANTEIDTKPQLEIYADDVICTHGATVGQLDEEALFYLETRGIKFAEASEFLINAFIKDNLQPFAKILDEGSHET